MTEYTWRQSGLDARNHAFASEDTLLRSRSVNMLTLAEPVEYHVTACGELLPVAYVMSHSGGTPCTLCGQRLTAVTKPPALPTEQVAGSGAPPIH
ncbi:hypothetical protein AB8O55_11690 [Saccharopolyspora cebuensis]|uniref:Uncharacterized protein n=1 Tax=Saccharopolyspora cebuensis TaxID=418759 RepID=A0ABV4CKV7_9PSEU